MRILFCPAPSVIYDSECTSGDVLSVIQTTGMWKGKFTQSNPFYGYSILLIDYSQHVQNFPKNITALSSLDIHFHKIKCVLFIKRRNAEPVTSA